MSTRKNTNRKILILRRCIEFLDSRKFHFDSASISFRCIINICSIITNSEMKKRKTKKKYRKRRATATAAAAAAAAAAGSGQRGCVSDCCVPGVPLA